MFTIRPQVSLGGFSAGTQTTFGGAGLGLLSLISLIALVNAPRRFAETEHTATDNAR